MLSFKLLMNILGCLNERTVNVRLSFISNQRQLAGCIAPGLKF